MSVPSLPAFAWPGGYPIVYLANSLEYRDAPTLTLCPACAAYLASVGEVSAPAPSVHWEGPAEICDDCACEMESAYGDPDASESEG